MLNKIWVIGGVGLFLAGILVLLGYLCHLTHVSGTGTATFRVTFNTDKEILEISNDLPPQVLPPLSSLSKPMMPQRKPKIPSSIQMPAETKAEEPQ